MRKKLSREELIELVQKILSFDGCKGEKYLNYWWDNVEPKLIETLKQNVPDPQVYSYLGDSRNLTSEEIVDLALSYKPIQLPPAQN